jgi:hypothetical protein
MKSAIQQRFNGEFFLAKTEGNGALTELGE